MTREDLINKISEKTELTKKDAASALSAVLEGITDALTSGDKVSLTGFGIFKVQKRSAREGINPQTKEKIQIPEKNVPVFKAGKTLKDAVL